MCYYDGGKRFLKGVISMIYTTSKLTEYAVYPLNRHSFSDNLNYYEMDDFSFDASKTEGKGTRWHSTELIDCFELIDHQEYLLSISHDSLFLSIVKAQLDKN